jgi:hypothetical protein
MMHEYVIKVRYDYEEIEREKRKQGSLGLHRPKTQPELLLANNNPNYNYN